MATSGQVSSFRKRARIKAGQIQGTRPSLYNSQLLISTGISSMDNVIGGGLAVGTVLLVEEDLFRSYSRLILKYYLAEAVLTNQSIFIASASQSTKELLKELPAPVDLNKDTTPTDSSGKSSPSSDQPQESDEKMKIAWRYQSHQKVQGSTGVPHFGHYYDLTQTMDPSLVDSASVSHGREISLEEASSSSIFPVNMNPHYCNLLNDIRARIQEGGFSTTHQAEKRSILRIGLHSLGSPLWGEASPSLTMFLIALRAELRSALATALITIPTHLFQDKSFVNRVERLCDTVIRVESFAGSEKEKNPAFKDYHGLFHLVQLPRLNSLVPAQPETPDLAFKLRRKKFTIERLHLPPELGGSAPESSGVRCGPSSSSSSTLDF